MKSGMIRVISMLLIIVLIFVLTRAAIVLINSPLFKTQKQAITEKYCSGTNMVAGDFCYQNLLVNVQIIKWSSIAQCS